MSNKNVIPPYKVAAAQDLSASFNAPKTNIQYLDRVAISVNVLSGTPSGTFSLQGRTSLSASDNASLQGPTGEWMALASTSQAAPASGSSIGWDVGFTGLTEIRVVYVRSSGSGTCDIWIAAKRSG